jgi:hypothetical protein
MAPEQNLPNRYWYHPSDDEEARRQHRLETALGVNQAVAEAILRLRSQIIELQSQNRRLEVELNAQNAGRQNRLASYREGYFEAAWVELEFREM